MSGGLTANEVEKWIKLDSSNAISQNAVYWYRIAANIPTQIIELLLSRQDPEQFYLGTTLRINKFGNESFYTLGFYTIQILEVDSFIIGRTNFPLKDFKIDYEPYINSSNYIDLDINFNNLDLSLNIFAQAIKAENVYGLTQIVQEPGQIYSRTALFTNDNTFEFLAIDDLPTNYFTTIPYDTWNTFSITPSILKLAKGYSFDDLLAKANAKGKLKSKKEIKAKINNPHLN